MPSTNINTKCLLQELSSEINQLIHRPEDNLTSYFPNYHTLLATFENYLREVEKCGNLLHLNEEGNEDEDLLADSWRIMPRIVVFREILDWDLIKDHGILFGTLENWGFLKGQPQLSQNYTNSKNPNQPLHILPNCSLVQIILLLYLQLQVQIFLQKADLLQATSQKSPYSNFYLLKLVISLLSKMQQSLSRITAFQKKSNQPHSPTQAYWINSDKLIKLLLMKTLNMKLTKETVKQPQQKQPGKQLNVSVKDILSQDFQGQRQNSEKKQNLMGSQSNNVTFEAFQDQRQQSFEESFHLENYLQLADVGVNTVRQNEVNREGLGRDYIEEGGVGINSVRTYQIEDRQDQRNLTWMGLINRC